MTRRLVLLERDDYGVLEAVSVTATVALARCERCGTRRWVLPCDVLPRKTYGLEVIEHQMSEYSQGDRSLRGIAWTQLGDRTSAHSTLHAWTEGFGAYALCRIDQRRNRTAVTARGPGWKVRDNEFFLNDSFAMEVDTAYVASTLRTRIFNNVISGSVSTANGAAILLNSAAYDVEVAHNTVAVATRLDASCISVSGAFGRPHRVHNNIFVNLLSGYVLSANRLNRYNYELDSNLYFSATGTRFRAAGVGYGGLAAWRSATGHDARSLVADPKFVGVGDLHLRSGSPARRRSRIEFAHVVDDLEGNPRAVFAPDIGAYESTIYLEQFGAGCPGTRGLVPELSAQGRVGLGVRSELVLQQVNSGFGYLIVGRSNSVWGSVSLPFRFGGVCDLLVSPDIRVPMLVVPRTIIPVDAPADRGLIGAMAYAQFAVFDPAAAGIGISFSNGILFRL